MISTWMTFIFNFRVILTTMSHLSGFKKTENVPIIQNPYIILNTA